MDYKEILAGANYIYEGMCFCGNTRTEKYKSTTQFPKSKVHIFPQLNKFSIIMIGKSVHKIKLSELQTTINTLNDN